MVTTDEIRDQIAETGEAFDLYIAVEGGKFHLCARNLNAHQAAFQAFWTLKRAGAYRRGRRHTRAVAAVVPAAGGQGRAYYIGNDGNVYEAGTCEARATA
jgi:hypothetical protein